MLSQKIIRERVEAGVEKGTWNPRLIPKAYALFDAHTLPEPFRRFASERIPTPALETITTKITSHTECLDTEGTACDRAGGFHIRALEAALEGKEAVSILTLHGEAVATLKRTRYGYRNVLAFRYAKNDGAFPLIPGGIYTVDEETVRQALLHPTIPLDESLIYPATIIHEHKSAIEGRRAYARAENLFEALTTAHPINTEHLRAA